MQYRYYAIVSGIVMVVFSYDCEVLNLIVKSNVFMKTHRPTFVRFSVNFYRASGHLWIVANSGHL